MVAGRDYLCLAIKKWKINLYITLIVHRILICLWHYIFGLFLTSYMYPFISFITYYLLFNLTFHGEFYPFLTNTGNALHHNDRQMAPAPLKLLSPFGKTRMHY